MVKKATTVFCAAGPGTTTPGTAGPRTVTGTIPATATTTLVSAFPELKGLDDPVDQTVILSVYGDALHGKNSISSGMPGRRVDACRRLAGRFY